MLVLSAWTGGLLHWTGLSAGICCDLIEFLVCAVEIACGLFLAPSRSYVRPVRRLAGEVAENCSVQPTRPVARLCAALSGVWLEKFAED